MKKLFLLGVILVFAVAGCTLAGKGEVKNELSLEEAKIKAVDFINNNLMGDAGKVSIKEATEQDGMYKIVVNMADGQEIDSFISKDGKKFFPSVMDIEEIETRNAAQNTSPAATPNASLADITKQEKPRVELFVMSHCPYGTQMEKGILPVLDALGEKIDFDLKFCDYAMHDKKEIDEQLAQYCVQNNEPSKLKEYLYCFLEEGNGEACLAKVGINQKNLDSCIAAADKEFKVYDSYNDKSTWKSGRFPEFAIHKADNQKYGITGSPGLVINGKKIQSGRDAASLLSTICAGFENPPSECDSALSSASPSPGFGFGTAAPGGTAAECGT